MLRFFAGSESDSVEEPVVGNVNKFCVVPPAHSGRPKKGHLVFDACFESGKFSPNFIHLPSPLELILVGEQVGVAELEH